MHKTGLILISDPVVGRKNCNFLINKRISQCILKDYDKNAVKWSDNLNDFVQTYTSASKIYALVIL